MLVCITTKLWTIWSIVLTLVSVDCIFLRRFYGGVITLMAGE